MNEEATKRGHEMRSAPDAQQAATAYPPWMLLARHGGGGFVKESDIVTGDTKTMAVARTSSGGRIVASICREPSSPALARICLCSLPDDTDMRSFAPTASKAYSAPYHTVVAAHGGSVVVRIAYYDYFVYVAGAAAADPARPPPSLHLLPPLPRPTEEPRCWSPKKLSEHATGILCRGEAEFVVAQLEIKMPPEGEVAKDDAAGGGGRQGRCRLLLFRNGQWRVWRPSSVVHCHGRDGDPMPLAKWRPQAVVPVGDGVLCWVDLSRGVIIFSDVFHQTADCVLCYVPYPDEARAGPECRFLCTNARGELKLVTILPSRCSYYGCSQHAAAVYTWTLDTDRKAWVLETGTTTAGDADSTELWALEKHSHQHLVYPVPVNGSGSGGGHVVSDESPPTTNTMEEESEHKHMAASRKRKKRRVSTSTPATPGDDVAQAGEHDVAPQDKATEPGLRRSTRQRRPSRRIQAP